MKDNKTQPSQQSVISFIESVDSEQRKKDAHQLLSFMKDITQEKAVLWGPSLIGFGKYHYKCDSGREGDFFEVGFSPRKTALTIYIMSGFSKHDALMSKLGKYKTGKSCLYVKKLDDIDMDILRELIVESIKFIRKKYPS